jgi:hypothetical protein
LLGELYIAIIMDRHEEPQPALTIALIRGLYLAIKWTGMKGLKLHLI